MVEVIVDKRRLGALRYAYVRVIDSLAPNTSDSMRDTLIDGDKYDFAIDGMIIYAGTITKPEKLLINVSLMLKEGEEKLLTAFPYSLRGTRNNQNYIPLAKDTGYPMLPMKNEIYIKIENTDPDNSVDSITYAILAYPVIKRP